MLSLSALALPHPSTIDVRSIGSLLDRYLLEVTPTKANRTQVDEPGYVARLKKLFGHMRLKDLEPHHVEWGLVKAHPFKKEVRFDGGRSSSGARERYIEDWGIVETLT